MSNAPCGKPWSRHYGPMSCIECHLIAQNEKARVIVSIELDEAALKELCADQDMSRTNVMRAALRLYQTVHRKQKQGLTMVFCQGDGTVITDSEHYCVARGGDGMSCVTGCTCGKVPA